MTTDSVGAGNVSGRQGNSGTIDYREPKQHDSPHLYGSREKNPHVSRQAEVKSTVRSSESKRNSVNRSNSPDQNARFTNPQTKNFTPGVAAQPLGRASQAASQSSAQSATINNRSPLLDFSGGPTANTLTTNAVSTNNIGSTSTGSTNSDPAAATDASKTTDGNLDAALFENNFPASKEGEVKISIDETHYISCQPIEANGPPCMCTYTVVDADGSNSWTEDNCS
jgi:hypothetical protein